MRNEMPDALRYCTMNKLSRKHLFGMDIKGMRRCAFHCTAITKVGKGSGFGVLTGAKVLEMLFQCA
jgi:hypothetical protein